MIVDIIERNRTTRQYSTAQIAMVLEDSFRREGIKICRRTILQTLKRLKYKSVKLTTKPGLNNDQKKVRVSLALKYQSWTIEDWKKVAWSDETSVILGSVRVKRRVWRLSKQAYNKHCLRRRWKGRMEFMFWACFCWHKRGPCYIWPKETEAMKAKYKKIIDRR